MHLDPPYFTKGSQLYLNQYTPKDHAALATFLSEAKFPWVMSYENVPQIRDLFSNCRRVTFNLGYCAREWKIGKELLVVPDHAKFPVAWPKRIPDKFITSADAIKSPLPVKAVALA